MKNTRDPFDDELRNRLDNYSEEPDDKLWSGIASNIETVKPPFPWKKWLSIGSATVVITAVVLYFSLNTTMNKELANTASASLTEETNKRQTTEDVSSLESDHKSDDPKVPTREQSLTTTETEGNKSGSNHQTANDGISASNSQREQTSDQKDQPLSETNESRLGLQKSRKATGVSSNNRTATTITGSTDNVVRQTGAGTTKPNSTSTSESQDNSKKSEVKDVSSLSTNQNVAAVEQAQTEHELQQSIPVSASSNEKQKDIEASSPIVVRDPVKDSLINKTEDSSGRNVVASNDDDKMKEKRQSNRKLSLYLTAMPTFGYQRVEANQNDNVFVESISKVSNFSTKRLGVRAEIGAEYALNKKFRVFGGVLYYQRKQTIEYVERVPVNDVIENPVDTVVILQPEFTSQARTFEFELRNLGLQVGVNYVLKEKKFLHTIGTGIEFHKALNKLPDEQRDLGFSSIPSTFVFANLYYRLQYPAQGRLRAVFQPTFNYSLYLNQDMNASFFVKPYGLGLNVGVTYHF